MDSPHHRPTWWQRWLQRLVSTRPVTWFLAHTLHYIDRWLFPFLDGKTSLTSLVFGLPVVMLTTTGARSGLPRSVPLVGLVDGEKVVLIASNFGQANHPSWYYNLKAHPQVALRLGGRSGQYLAREASDDEREAYWQQAVRVYPGYRLYQQRARRRISVFVLAPQLDGCLKPPPAAVPSPDRTSSRQS